MGLTVVSKTVHSEPTDRADLDFFERDGDEGR
jgi:hypothetical protein